MQLDKHGLTALLVALLVVSVAAPASGVSATRATAGPTDLRSGGAAGVQATDYSTQSISGTEEVTVIDVTDGDTVTVEYDNGSTDEVRLLGVDTPEVYGSTSPSEFEGVPDTGDGETCLGYEGEVASAMAKNRLLGERVTLKFDSEADRRGYYGRLLAYVYIDGENFNYQLIDHGHARVYDSTFSMSDEFYAAESDAQSAGIGVWACEDPASELGEVTIERFHPDPVGDDYANMNEEFVVLQNRRSASADLGGWEMEDEYGNQYDFPGSFSLDSGQTVTLHTGTGSDTASHLYWGRTDYAVWNNDGDTGYLYTDGGEYVNSKSY
ncbi:lamin tail domain-containing protein [Halorussus caseinilyticus]|uniref:lamin tail domain-containing protein n=1 Tax=Halorussus caseinilyticus TaxID=3034025 RepID=UPI0023E76FC0|nr:lamin tail domain-containing protein [Halorussus sp. DT72]